MKHFLCCISVMILFVTLINCPAGEEIAPDTILPVSSSSLPVEKKIDHRQFTGQIESIQEEPIKHIYTDSDAIALAQMAWGEAGAVKNQILPDGRVISSTAQKAAVMWIALNQYDAGIADSLIGVIAKPNNFYGYASDHPVQEDLLSLAYDVLDRWEREKLGETDVGRVLPPDYIYFTGDGKYNYFRNEFKSKVYYDWRLEDIYANIYDEINRPEPFSSGRLAAPQTRNSGRTSQKPIQTAQ